MSLLVDRLKDMIRRAAGARHVPLGAPPCTCPVEDVNYIDVARRPEHFRRAVLQPDCPAHRGEPREFQP